VMSLTAAKRLADADECWKALSRSFIDPDDGEANLAAL